MFGQLSIDRGPENKDVVAALAETYGIYRVVVSAYHPQGQDLVKRGHQPLVAALAKYGGNWVRNLTKAL